jgi:large subunit ribosomal protein L29
MTSDEIRGKIRDLNEEMFNLRFRNSMKQLDNPLQIRILRKDIARLKTVIKEYEMGIREVKKPQG